MTTTTPRATVLARLAALFRGSAAAPSANELETSLAEASELLPEIAAELEARQAERTDALLVGDADGLAKAEVQIAELQRERERLEVVIARVPARLEATRAAEAEAGREARSRELERLQGRGRVLVRRYEEVAAELAPLLAELHAIDRALHGAREREPGLPRYPTPPSAERTATVISLADACVVAPARERGPSWLGRAPTVDLESAEARQAKVAALDADFHRRREVAGRDRSQVEGEVLVDDGTGKRIGAIHNRIRA